MADDVVPLTNDPNIIVTSALVSGRVELRVNGVVIGTVDDTWNVAPPGTTRVTIGNLPNGTPVSAQWQPWNGGNWTSFNQTSTGCYYDFSNPPPGSAPQEFRFTAQLQSGEVCDPKLVLRTKISED